MIAPIYFLRDSFLFIDLKPLKQGIGQRSVPVKCISNLYRTLYETRHVSKRMSRSGVVTCYIFLCPHSKTRLLFFPESALMKFRTCSKAPYSMVFFSGSIELNFFFCGTAFVVSGWPLIEQAIQLLSHSLTGPPRAGFLILGWNGKLQKYMSDLSIWITNNRKST